jgi:hypothetical protein
MMHLRRDILTDVFSSLVGQPSNLFVIHDLGFDSRGWKDTIPVDFIVTVVVRGRSFLGSVAHGLMVLCHGVIYSSNLKIWPISPRTPYRRTGTAVRRPFL